MTYQEPTAQIERKKMNGASAAKSVLIVEDNELNMKLFHDLLDAHGYATLQTQSGMEALELAREHAQRGRFADAVRPEQTQHAARPRRRQPVQLE